MRLSTLTSMRTPRWLSGDLERARESICTFVCISVEFYLVVNQSSSPLKLKLYSFNAFLFLLRMPPFADLQLATLRHTFTTSTTIHHIICQPPRNHEFHFLFSSCHPYSTSSGSLVAQNDGDSPLSCHDSLTRFMSLHQTKNHTRHNKQPRE